MMFVEQQAHQFGHRQGRMGIIELDRHLRRKLIKAGMIHQIVPDDVLERTTDEEIFLYES
jgi:hypothetical protein